MRPATATPLWRDARVLGVAAQILFVVLLVAGTWGAKVAVERSMVRQNIRLDWGFFRHPAGFDLTALTWTMDLNRLSLKRYSPEDSYAEAMIAGLFNTIKVAILGIVLALGLGLMVGVARLSRNWLVNRLALGYVEVLRNTPLLVQLFFWYFGVFLQLPTGAATSPPITFLSGFVVLTNRGLAVGGVLTERFGRQMVDGGFQMTSEFSALVLGLAVYTSAFIAEIVRGGVLAIPRGQMEAARSLGLNYRQALRQVVLPQALRIIIPPLGNQFLNLTKNSSLAIGVGFADMLTSAMTVASQSFRALETFTFVTLAYLALSLTISAVLNLVRARLALPGG
ncbi:MAG: ABC transporter permease subunit [Armatimonadota bacterium]|nr:ABC transporter permease subunit [Armatimonadota bacterium]MDR7518601.1 ABC transporter permease subunit [Armatimonadota bacterium]MDR7548468.1 ABC transporter permease subunit [Armatimonadota bacterium]